MLAWLRLKAWQSAVGADFEDKYGLNIFRLSQTLVGTDNTKQICEKVVQEHYHNTILAGEQIARILEQANGIPVNSIIRERQFELLKQGKWNGDFIEVPFRDPSVKD